MKKIISASIALSMLLPCVSAIAEPEVKVIFNGQEISYSVEPIIENGEVLLPVRQTMESQGMTVVWNPFTSSVTAEKEGLSIIMVMGGKTMLKNSGTVYSNTEPRIVNGSAMMSAQSVADCLGMKLSWDSDSYILEYTGGVSYENGEDNNATDESGSVRDISDGDFHMYTGDSITLTASKLPNKSWTSGKSSVASVSGDGVVTANSAGTVDIAAYNPGTGKMVSCRITVEEAIRPHFKSESVEINSKEDTDLGLSVNGGYTGSDLEWTVEDDDVCTVNSRGIATGINGGTTTVRATSPTGHSAEIEVTVNQKCSILRLAETTVVINDSNNGYKLKAEMTPETANEKVTWSSENTEYLLVDENGVVTAVQTTPRYYKITAKTASGKTATCKVAARIKAVEADLEVIAIDNGEDESTTRVNGKTISTYGEPVALTLTNNAEAPVTLYANYKYTYIKRGNDKIYATLVNPNSTKLESYGSNIIIQPGDTKTVYFAEYHRNQNEGLVMKSDDLLTFRFTCSGVAYWCEVRRSGTFSCEKE